MNSKNEKIKIWVDDIRPAPEGYVWCKSVNETIEFIEATERCINRCMERGHKCFLNREYDLRNKCYDAANSIDISLIDIDHDAGDYISDGGDYIKILDRLEEKGLNYPIRIHSMNPVGRENMRKIIRKNNWKEIL